MLEDKGLGDVARLISSHVSAPPPLKKLKKLKAASSPREDQKITFGKFKGRMFSEMEKTEKGYCKWALNQVGAAGPLGSFVNFLKAGK